MKLTVLERLILLRELPKEGNFATLRILRSLVSSLGLSEEEYKEFGVKQDGERITWNNNGDVETEIEIGEKATDIIVETLKELDDNKKLTEETLQLI